MQPQELAVAHPTVQDSIHVNVIGLRTQKQASILGLRFGRSPCEPWPEVAWHSCAEKRAEILRGLQSISPRARSQSRRTSRGKLGRSGCSLLPPEASDAHQSSRGPAEGGDAAEQRTYRSWGDRWTNLRRNINSQRGRRESAACDQA